MKIFLSFLFMFVCIGLGAYIVYRVQTGQDIIPSFAANGNVVKIDDRDQRFNFKSSPTRTAAGYPHWDQVSQGGAYILRGGTAQQCNGLNNAGCFATLDLTGQNFSFDQITLGFSTGPNRTSADIYVDGKKIAEVDSNAATYTTDYRNYKLWSSAQGAITCGKHNIKIVPNQRTGTGQKTFTLDFADIKKCTPSTGGSWQKIENTDARFDYGGNNASHNNLPFWDIFNNSGLSGGSSHACRTDINSGCRAIINLTTSFNQLQIRALKGFNASSADIYIDNQKIGEADAYKSGASGIGTLPLDFLDWTSSAFACNPHTIKIVPNGRTGQNAKSFTMDYLQIMSCTPDSTDKTCASDADCDSDKKCVADQKKCRLPSDRHLGCFQNSCSFLNGGGVNIDGCQQSGGSCQTSSTHLICENNACKEVSGAGTDATGCIGKTAGFSPCDNNNSPQTFVVCGSDNTCQTSPTATSNDPGCSGLSVGQQCRVNETDLICQGNTDAPARCFDCKRDIGPSSTTSEINILDFSCFAKFYGKEVGKN